MSTDKIQKKGAVTYRTINTGLKKKLASPHPQPDGSQKAKAILQHKVQQFKTIYNGKDVTPKPLNPLAYEEGKERQLSVFDMDRSQSNIDVNVFQTQSTTKFYTQLHHQTLEAENTYQQSYLNTSPDNFMIEAERRASKLSDQTYSEKSQTSIGFGTGDMAPTNVRLVLKETCTWIVFELPSITAEKNTEEGDTVEKDNEYYDYITLGKGRNRKVVNAEVQTKPILLKTRCTTSEGARHKHSHTFASIWDMYDTFAKEDRRLDDENEDENDYREGIENLESLHSIDSYQMSSEERQMLKLIKNTKFLNAVCIVERILANNNFNDKQKRFWGLSDPHPMRDDIEYNYNLTLLWTFQNAATENYCVSALCWNPENRDVLAVGYGKFYFTDRTNGMIMLWNAKNPVQPERTYNFEEPVTALDFSKQHPNLLAIGFYDGKVRVIDVSARDVSVIGQSSRMGAQSFESVWQVVWFTGDDYYKDEEQIIVTYQDGRINKFRQTVGVDMSCTRIMKIAKAECKLKGIETLRKCPVPGLTVARNPGALIFCRHPADSNIYYVGTDEGVIHKCSTNYYHQHLDLFLAHDGPIYQIKFSSFCSKVFITCGDDWAVRIWAEGICIPLVELYKNIQSVQGADWSPTHSTIICNISGRHILIWDLQRKVYLPQSVTASPTNCRNTIVQFTHDGRCLVVGDVEGNVHIYALDDMPFPAFFQEDLLTESIKRALITKPELLRKLGKLGSLNFDKSKFEKHFR